MRVPRTAAALILVSIGVASAGGMRAQQPQGGLRIVVIEGENAVNIIQQKTAVAPVVEVRDRNDQPVGGVIVRFAIRSGKATFGGPKTLAVTTNTAGRAAVTTLTPTGSGALQISATATFQGQTAAVTIAQTNVMSVAAAAGASSGGTAAGGTAGGAGAGGGGGISATTVGIIGGAAAGGAIVAVKALSGPAGTPYSGQFSGDIIVTGPPPFCGFTERINAGTLTIHLDSVDANGVKGTATVSEDHTTVYSPSCGLSNVSFHEDVDIESLTGSSSTLKFNLQKDNTFTAGNGQTGVRTLTLSFTGSFNGTEITGVLTQTEANRSSSGPTITASGTSSFGVTLR